MTDPLIGTIWVYDFGNAYNFKKRYHLIIEEVFSSTGYKSYKTYDLEYGYIGYTASDQLKTDNNWKPVS